MNRIANRIVSFMLAITMITLTATAATAQATSPLGVFGPQPALTFGGSGIDNNFVLTNSNEATLNLQLAFSVTPRYGNPAVTNNGNGVFYVQAGTDPGQPANALMNYAMWNFDMAITGANVGAFRYVLFYDWNPAVGNSGDFGSSLLAPAPFQDSWNSGMDFLGTTIAGIIVPPTFGNFNPNAFGEYGFALAAFNLSNNAEVARIQMMINATADGLPPGPSDVVPEPATMTFVATGLVGLAGAGAKRRKNKKPRMSAAPLA